MTIKENVIGQLNAVCKALDKDITLTGIKNAGVIVGAYSIIVDVVEILEGCDITKITEDTNGGE